MIQITVSKYSHFFVVVNLFHFLLKCNLEGAATCGRISGTYIAVEQLSQLLIPVTRTSLFIEYFGIASADFGIC